MTAPVFLNTLRTKMIVRAELNIQNPLETSFEIHCFVPMGVNPETDGFARISWVDSVGEPHPFDVRLYYSETYSPSKLAAVEIHEWKRGPWTGEDPVVCALRTTGLRSVHAHNIDMIVQFARAHGVMLGSLYGSSGFDDVQKVTIASASDRLAAICRGQMLQLQEIMTVAK